MLLREWMKKNRYNCVQMGNLIKCDAQYLRLIRSGKMHPSVRLARRIYDFTNREIDILPLLFPDLYLANDKKKDEQNEHAQENEGQVANHNV